MARIYAHAEGVAGGKKKTQLERVVAMHATVQRKLDTIALSKALRAEALLTEHKVSGDSFITIEYGDVDRYVVLNDEAGQSAAMLIEYGRPGRATDENGDPSGGSEGTWVLHDAFDLPHPR